MSKKRLVERVYRDQEGKEQASTFEYDTQGRKLKTISDDEQGRKIKEEEYLYDDKGNVVKVLHAAFSIDGKVFSRSTEAVEYDAQNREIRHVLIDSREIIFSEWQSEYDDHGRLARSRDVDPQSGEIKSTIEHIYDEKTNRETVVTKDKEGKVLKTIEVESDEGGIETRTVVRNGEGEILEINEREYDSQGEPIRATKKNAEGEVVSTHEWRNKYE